MKTRFNVYLWGGGILIASCLASLPIPIMTKIPLIITLSWFIGCAIFEIYCRLKESKYININRDTDPRKIMVSNNGYDMVEGCVIKINKLYVLGKNQTCEKIVDENWNYIFKWDDDSKNPNITIGGHNLIDVYNVTDKEIFLLFQDMPKISLPLYKDLKNGKNTRKGKYQIEIILFGNGKTDGGSDLIKKRSFWEIYYQSNGEGLSPTFKMEKIEKMKKTTGKIDDEQFSNEGTFSLSLKKDNRA